MFDLDMTDGTKVCLGIPQLAQYSVQASLEAPEILLDYWLTALEVSHSRAVRNKSAIVDSFM